MNIVYTAEQLKSMVNEDIKEGYLAHIRAIPISDSGNKYKVLNGTLQFKDKVFKNLPVDETRNIISNILTKWINRELQMKTGTLSIDDIFEDLKPLKGVEDGLVSVKIKEIFKKLNYILEIKPSEIKTSNNDFIMFLEPFKVNFVDIKIKIPEEMLVMPMDIARSKLYAVMDDVGITIDKNKLNIVIDRNNNAFIVDENIHKRVTMKVFTNKDIVVNQVIDF